jgi:hypothetical protein
MNSYEKQFVKVSKTNALSIPMSEALITVDSRDGITYDNTGLVSASKNPFDININIGTQFFGSGVKRLRLKEALITWNIPNVNPTNNTLFLENDDGTTYNVVIPEGFYTPNELAQAVENNLNINNVFSRNNWSCFYDERSGSFTLSAVKSIQPVIDILNISGTAGTYNNWIVKNLTTGESELSFTSLTPVVDAFVIPTIPFNVQGRWNVGDSVELITPQTVESTGTPITMGAVGTINSLGGLIAIAPSFRILPFNTGKVSSPLTSTLATMMGFSTVSSGSVKNIIGSHASMLYTEYVDIVSTQLTKNQTLYYRSTNYKTGNNVLARVYIAPERLYSTTSTNIIGTRPFIFNSSFTVPKEINWDETDPLASINIQLKDSRGNILYTPPTQSAIVGTGPNETSVETCGNTGYVLLTLGASESLF